MKTREEGLSGELLSLWSSLYDLLFPQTSTPTTCIRKTWEFVNANLGAQSRSVKSETLVRI